MGSGPRWLLMVAIILLGIGEWAWGIWSGMTRLHQVSVELAKQPAPDPLKEVGKHLFTRAETYAFLARAKQAEAIRDPLQRCLAYPDPPGSHWSHDAVDAYCRYRYQPVLPFADIERLIRSGHAAEVDRRLAEALQAQMTQPDAHGRLDRTFYEDFENGSFDIRPTLDAWKRDSPNSAFAYAASGYAYVQMAADARGGQYIADTPQSNIDAMDKLLAQADSDLRRAIELDPRITPAYRAMVHAGGLSLGRAYGLDAARRGLAVAPDNFGIYSMRMWLEQPKWGGSLEAMQRLAGQSRIHARHNPLLVMLQSKEPFYKVDNCACDKQTELAAYPAAFDQLASSNDLLSAGNAAVDTKYPQVSAIYLSEALRFDQALDRARVQRVYDLLEFDEAAWAVDEASRLLAASPHDQEALNARAQAYEAVEDYPHAEQDFRTLISLDPGDMQSLARLGSLYVNSSHDWDKGWKVADQLIKAQPENPYGWMLRATIQQKQPRAGMNDTVDYLEAHFGNNPELAKMITRMRAAAVMQTHSGNQVLAAKGQPQG